MPAMNIRRTNALFRFIFLSMMLSACKTRESGSGTSAVTISENEKWTRYVSIDVVDPKTMNIVEEKTTIYLLACGKVNKEGNEVPLGKLNKYEVAEQKIRLPWGKYVGVALPKLVDESVDLQIPKIALGMFRIELREDLSSVQKVRLPLYVPGQKLGGLETDGSKINLCPH